MMISGSYLGLINLQDSTQNLASQSGYVELQDGVGENVGAAIDASSTNWKINNNLNVGGTLDVTGSSHFRSDVEIDGDLDISGSFVHSGSIDVLGDVTIQGDITANVGNFDTVNARLLNITEESASVIFSSGSNVLGDEETDRQDLIGQVIVSGTLGVEGNSAFTGSLTVSNEISSSTINGIGNVTSYSSSVDNRLVQLEVSSGSQDSQLSNLENFTASQENINSGYNSYTSSTDNRLTNIEATTASLETNKLDVSVYNTDSASFDNRIDQLESDTGSQDSRLDSLEAFTGSQETINGFYNSFTASNGNDSLNTFTSSADSRLNNLETFTSSFDVNFVSTGSFNAYTQSTDIRLNNLELETSSIDDRLDNIEATTASLQVEVDALSNKTGSYATTGSNVFDGAQVITGSVNGNVENITITSNTASIDCDLGNFFLVSGSGTVHLTSTNISPGQTISVRVQSSNGLLVTVDEQTLKFPSGLEYSNTISSSYDLLSFVSFDNTSLLGVSVNTFDL